MGRFAVRRDLELLLKVALLAVVPTALSGGGGEDLYGGASPDLVPDGYLIRADDRGIGLADPGSPSDLREGEGSLLRAQAQDLRSAYVTKSGELHFTASTECNQLNPVCVGRMGIAEKIGDLDIATTASALTGGLAQGGNR